MSLVRAIASKRGIGNELGITFGTICDLSNATCCYAWVPKDEIGSAVSPHGPGLKSHGHDRIIRLNGILIRNQFAGGSGNSCTAT